MNREDIVAGAITMANEIGLINMTRASLCERVGIKDGSFHYHVGCKFTDFVEEIKPHTDGIQMRQVSKSRANGALRKEHILNIAVEESRTVGFNNITHRIVAEKAGISPSLVQQHYNINQLRNAIMKKAVKGEIIEIIAQGIAHKNERALGVSQELKDKAVELLLG